MANFYNPKYNIEDLISFTENTIRVASFQQIKDSLIKTMQKLYGNDIDVSSASADGQWIMALALLYDKTFGVIKTLEQNFNVNEAKGKYLDILCSYNNIFRKEASQSYCHLLIKPSNNADYKLTSNGKAFRISCIDINKKIWTWEEGVSPTEENPTFTIPAKGINLKFVCEEYGEISATMDTTFNKNNPVDGTNGDINQVYLPDNISLKCWQTESAILGRNEESDYDLRTRRTIELGNNSITVLSGLEGSLREINAIKDIAIYNNNTNNDITLNENYDGVAVDNKKYYGDGTDLDAHNVYIVLRYEKNLNPDKSEIGNIILNKMTPGVSTNFTLKTGQGAIAFGEKIEWMKEITFGNTNVPQYIYWKKATPRAIPLTLKFMINKDFEVNGNQIYKDKIVDDIKDYIFNLTFKDGLSIANIINAINSNAKQVNGSLPYICVSGEFDIYNEESQFITGQGYDQDTQYQHNHFGYFDYSSAGFSNVAHDNGVSFPKSGYIMGTMKITVS